LTIKRHGKMKTKNMKKTIIAVLTGFFLLSISATAQATLTVTQTTDPAPNNWGEVRYTNFVNARGKEVFIGVPNFNSPGSSASGDMSWGLTTNITTLFSYIPTTSTLQAQNTAPGNTFNVSVLPYAPKPGFNTLQIGVYNSHTNASKILGLNNLALYQADGITLIGSIGNNLTFDVNGGTTAKYWNVTGYDFSQGFVIKGQIERSNGIDGASYINFAAVPIPAAVWLLGSGLFGLAVLRRRTKT
jgi:hypothetical protein